MTQNSMLADLFVLNPTPKIQRKLERDGLHIIAEFNAYVGKLAGGNVHDVKKVVDINPESGTSYLKVEVNGTTMMIVDPLHLVKALARPFEERSGISFTPTLEV